MSRYVITEEQLNNLKDQIKNLSKLNEIKEEKIKNLERFKTMVSESKNADLFKKIERLEIDVGNLKTINKNLTDLEKNNYKKIENLENILKEERKLREYSESLAKQVEVQCAEECLLRQLTNELCQLQKDEIEIENKKIEELQMTIEKFKNQLGFATQLGNNFQKDNNLKLLVYQFRNQLIEMYDDVRQNSKYSNARKKYKETLESWLEETNFVMNDINEIEQMKNDLNYLKNKIEDENKNLSHLM